MHLSLEGRHLTDSFGAFSQRYSLWYLALSFDFSSETDKSSIVLIVLPTIAISASRGVSVLKLQPHSEISTWIQEKNPYSGFQELMKKNNRYGAVL